MKAQIGIDVSKATLDVCYLEDIQTLRIKRQEFDNTSKGFKQLISWLKKVTHLNP